MLNAPALSVLLAVYNDERFVAEAIDSILAQDFSNFELLVLDDGSDDGTPGIVQNYADRDRRIRLIRETHHGHASSLNRLLAEARAPLVARMDADDICLPTRFGKQVAFLEANPDYGVLGCETAYIDENGRPAANRNSRWVHRHEDLLQVLEEGPPLAHPAVMMRLQLVRAVGGYREAFRHSEDYDLWLRLSTVTKMANLPETLLLYRLHSNQLSDKYLPEQTRTAAVARLAHRTRRRGLPDPMQGRTRLPPAAELDSLFGEGAMRDVNEGVFAASLHSLDHLVGDAWEAVLDQSINAPDRRVIRLAGRLLARGHVLASMRVAWRFLRGLAQARRTSSQRK